MIVPTPVDFDMFYLEILETRISALLTFTDEGAKSRQQYQKDWKIGTFYDNDFTFALNIMFCLKS